VRVLQRGAPDLLASVTTCPPQAQHIGYIDLSSDSFGVHNRSPLAEALRQGLADAWRNVRVVRRTVRSVPHHLPYPTACTEKSGVLTSGCDHRRSRTTLPISGKHQFVLNIIGR
jgi:hypothetical protein